MALNNCNLFEIRKSMSNYNFRSTMGCFLTGVTVVTTSSEGKLLGVTANSFSGPGTGITTFGVTNEINNSQAIAYTIIG